MRRLTEHRVQKDLGTRLVLWINPANIEYSVGTRLPNIKTSILTGKRIARLLPGGALLASLQKRVLLQMNSFLIEAEQYKRPTALQATTTYRKIEDLLDNQLQPQHSIWYLELSEELKNQGYARHKGFIFKSHAEILSFFHNYVFVMIETMRQNGFIVTNGDIGFAVIDECGIIHKASSANHRFCIAKLLGIHRFPLRIAGVHRDWFDQQVTDIKNLDRLAEKLAEVESQFQ